MTRPSRHAMFVEHSSFVEMQLEGAEIGWVEKKCKDQRAHARSPLAPSHVHIEYDSQIVTAQIAIDDTKHLFGRMHLVEKGGIGMQPRYHSAACMSPVGDEMDPSHAATLAESPMARGCAETGVEVQMPVPGDADDRTRGATISSYSICSLEGS